MGVPSVVLAFEFLLLASGITLILVFSFARKRWSTGGMSTGDFQRHIAPLDGAETFILLGQFIVNLSILIASWVYVYYNIVVPLRRIS